MTGGTSPAIGHNNPPDGDRLLAQAIEQLREERPQVIADMVAPFSGTIHEISVWCDGDPITSDAQLDALDGLIAFARKQKNELEAARKAQSKPFGDAAKVCNAQWKAEITAAEQRFDALVALGAPYRQKKAQKAAEAKRQAEAEAEMAVKAAQAAAAQANAANLAEQQQATALADQAQALTKFARQSGKNTPRGLRTRTVVTVTDNRALVNWVIKNDPDSLIGWLAEYANKRGKQGTPMPGVTVEKVKEAY